MRFRLILDEDFVNFKLPSMFICAPFCSMKCGLEYGDITICQNYHLMRDKAGIKSKQDDEIVQRYLDNSITEAVVIGGLEPFDSTNNVINFVKCFRGYTNDPVVIYTGYYETEVYDDLDKLREHPNIIVKFGRYLPNHKPHIDKVLGVELSSDNQRAVKIS